MFSWIKKIGSTLSLLKDVYDLLQTVATELKEVRDCVENQESLEEIRKELKEIRGRIPDLDA
jgi:cell shape-determining protein MreC